MYRRIRDLREDKDLYQKDLAEYLKCTQVCYSHYEMGKRDIPTDVLIKLADFYHTSTFPKSGELRGTFIKSPLTNGLSNRNSSLFFS